VRKLALFLLVGAAAMGTELSGESGDKAVETCREQAQQGEPSDEVEFSDVSVNGDTADATFDVSGGSASGHIEAQLIKEDGDWLINEVNVSESK
jgi:hypothetical protein